ncbi:MAG: DUF3795 domain-containing protein [Chitinophagales bacterium]
MLAYCGLSCNTCPVHLATLQQGKLLQQTMRASIAEECLTLYGMKLRAEDITDCDGCRANTGKLFSGCLTCEIRKCAISKNIESCALCNDYVCEKLKKHFSLDPGAQAKLEELRQINKISTIQ